MPMSTRPQPNDNTELPPWEDCDCFCIHDYAGGAALPCGWRGRFADAGRDAGGNRLLCPRCRSMTLFRIPSGHITQRRAGETGV